jgi:citronellol/citronellal dehydrogenase
MGDSINYPETDEDLSLHRTIFAPDLLKDKVVLVTGGGSGIGRATAWLAMRLGALVVIAGRSEEKLARTVGETKHLTQGNPMVYRIMDIRDPGSVANVIDSVYDSIGKLDILVNSAGGQFPQPAINFSKKGWRAVIDTNLNGTWNVMDYAAKKWQEKGSLGSIVNVVVVGQGLHGIAHTVAARAGVIAFAEKAAVEWAPYGIRVNCVAPGCIKTEGWKVYPELVRARYPKTNPMMRAGSPWEIAEAIIFVGGPGGLFINGETLVVDGGGRHWGEIWAGEKPGHFLEASRVYEPSKKDG